MSSDKTEHPMSTIQLHRVLRAPCDRVYRAFLDPQARCKWLPPYGYVGTVHASDERVGGTYRMSFTNFSTGASHYFGGKYLELKENELIRYTDKFEDPNLAGEMLKTVTFREVSCGTELKIKQENLPQAFPAEECYTGWQESLAQLMQLVQVEVLDASPTTTERAG
jgi:uncharacterized protein YndB with AHSA1/START domain